MQKIRLKVLELRNFTYLCIRNKRDGPFPVDLILKKMKKKMTFEEMKHKGCFMVLGGGMEITTAICLISRESRLAGYRLDAQTLVNLKNAIIEELR